MRILFTADPELPVPPGLYGGIERLVDMWIREARARGHTVGLCANADSTARVDQFFPWPGTRSQNASSTMRNALALRKAARAFRADVVHSSSRLAYTIPLLLTGQPVVQTYHRFPGQRQVGLAARLGGKRIAFTGISEFITRMGAPGGGRWNTVPNCIDIDRLAFQPAVPDSAPLVFLGRIEEVKGAREAIAIARAAGASLLIAGNKCSDENAVRYWREHIEPHLDERIRYVGPVDDAGKDALLRSSSGLLAPAQWEEPFGLVYAEALACGTPAIGTPRGGIPEIIAHGRTGFLVESVAEGVEAVRSLKNLDRRLCRQTAEERYSPRAALDRFEEVYRTVIR